MEKYITFTLDPLKFFDTLSFMAASLDSLVSNLRADRSDKFQITNAHFKGDDKKEGACSEERSLSLRVDGWMGGTSLHTPTCQKSVNSTVN